MANGYEDKLVNKTYAASVNGLVVVRVQATPTKRDVTANGYVDKVLVASASAADNFVQDVISSSVQTFTMPVRKGSKWLVRRLGSGDAEVRWFSFA